MRRSLCSFAIYVVAIGVAASCSSSPSNHHGSGGNGSGGTSNGSGGAGSGGANGSGGASTGSGGTRAASGGSPAGSGGTSSGGASGSGGSKGSGGSAPGSGGSTTTGAGGAANPGVAPSAITGLKVDPNPNNVLSCFVSWTTDQAADSVVQFGTTSLQWEISDAALVTSHKVLVIGMKQQLNYMLKALSKNSGGQVSATSTFMTGTPPAQIPVGTVMINDTTRAQAGWTLMNVQKGQGDTRARSDFPPYAVMYDSDGQPVWYYVDGNKPDVGGAVSTQLTDKGVLIGPSWDANATVDAVPPVEVDFAGNIIWTCTACANKNFTHHASKLSNGDYMVIEYITTNGLQNPFFREIDANNKVVWSLDYASLVPPPTGSSS